MKSFIIERPEVHHAIIQDNSFSIEHPLDCPIVGCDIMEVLIDVWVEKPAENGRYQIAVLEGIPMLAPGLPSRRYRVKPLK